MALRCLATFLKLQPCPAASQLLLTFSPAVGNPVGVRLGLETAVTPLDTSGNAAWFSLRAYSVGDPAHDGSQLAKALKVWGPLLCGRFHVFTCLLYGVCGGLGGGMASRAAFETFCRPAVHRLRALHVY